MTSRANPKRFAKKAASTAREQREIQDRIDKLDKKKAPEKPGAMQAGARTYPVHFPKEHLEKHGKEADLQLAPMYDAPHYKGSEKLQDKVALITGGDSGIGRAVAVLFAREGADVAIAYLTEGKDAKETRRAVEAEGRRCITLAGDVADPTFCKAAVKATLKSFGRLDVLVNNAVFQEHAEDIADLSDDHFDRTLKTNLYGYFYMAKAAVPHGAGQCNHHERVGHRHRRQQEPAGLFDDQGRHSRVYALALGQPHCEGHPGQLRCARPGLDTAQSGRP